MPRKRTITDETLLDTALVVVREAGPDGLTFAALAPHAGLAASTIVQRFGTKAALLRAALSRAWDLLDDATATAVATAGLHPPGAIDMLVQLSGQYRADDEFADQLLLLREDLRDPVLRARGRAWIATLVDAVERRLEPALADAGGLGALVVAQWQGTLTVWSFERDGSLTDAVRASLRALFDRFGIARDRREAVTEQVFSEELDSWLRSDEVKTLGALNEVFDERSFAVAIMLLMFPAALPIPTGGATHVLEIVTVLLAAQMIAGRDEIWLPQRWRDRELGATITGKALPFVIRRVRTFERLSRRRAPRLFDQRWFLRVLGLTMGIFTIGAFLAPPFSGLDTLPALGVVLIALGIVLHDVAFLVAGAFIGTSGIALILVIGRAAARFFRELF